MIVRPDGRVAWLEAMACMAEVQPEMTTQLNQDEWHSQFVSTCHGLTKYWSEVGARKNTTYLGGNAMGYWLTALRCRGGQWKKTCAVTHNWCYFHLWTAHRGALTTKMRGPCVHGGLGHSALP